MKQLIIGYGEIGQAVYEVLDNDADIQIYDTSFEHRQPLDADVLHICFPCTSQTAFVEDVLEYMKEAQPEHVIIWSTVPIGTTREIPGAVHSPVEGRHPKLAESIKKMVRWIGTNDNKEVNFWNDYFEILNIVPFCIVNSDYTEALKLLSTTEYGINLMFADYKARVAAEIGMDYQLSKLWNRSYNLLYHDIGMDDKFQKFVLDPPNGKIGGHCVIPNAKLLDAQYPDELLKLLKEYE